MTTAPAEPSVGLWSRWSDRLNPILVREVQQAVKGRAFALTVLVALGITVVIATAAVARGAAPDAGRGVFDAGLTTLVPLVLFVVPMQAYQSMRLELRAGIVEQLLLSRLRPRAIVAGKLAAALVQFLLYVSLLAPLLATSYLLRGVDVATIATSLGLALVFCLGATAAAISAAAQGTAAALQPIGQVVAAFGFGMLTFAMMTFVGTGEYARDLGWLLRRAEFPAVLSAIVLGAAAATTLSALTAQTFLLHAFENRSTGFRIYLFVLPLLALAWIGCFVEPALWPERAAAVVFVATLLGIAFGVFFCTEQRELSPRVRAHVPRRAWAAVLAAPWLPGRERGLLCLLLYLAAVGALGWLVWPEPAAATLVFAPGVRVTAFTTGLLRLAAFTAAYGLIYLTLGKGLRRWLPPTFAGNQVARFCVPGLCALFCLVPVLIDVFLRDGVEQWHGLHVLNPFWTSEQFAFRPERGSVLSGLLAAAAGCVLLQLRGLVQGIAEVRAAAALRRQAEAGRRG